MYTNILHFNEVKGSIHIETELISFMVQLFNGGDKVCGTTTTGGTESIFLAMYSYREYARKYFGIKRPEMIINESCHAAFLKAAHYFNIKLITLKVSQKTGLTKLNQYINAISSNTICIVMSGVNYTHGLADPVYELNAYLSKKRSRILMHVDGCLGGYITSISSFLKDNRF